MGGLAGWLELNESSFPLFSKQRPVPEARAAKIMGQRSAGGHIGTTDRVHHAIIPQPSVVWFKVYGGRIYMCVCIYFLAHVCLDALLVCRLPSLMHAASRLVALCVVLNLRMWLVEGASSPPAHRSAAFVCSVAITPSRSGKLSAATCKVLCMMRDWQSCVIVV